MAQRLGLISINNLSDEVKDKTHERRNLLGRKYSKHLGHLTQRTSDK